MPLLLVCLAVFHPDHAAAGLVMLVVFTVGLHGHRARALVVGALMAPVVAAGVLITSTRGDVAPKMVAYVALVLGALAAGDAVRARQELVRVLAQEEERERAALVQHRFDEQRLRYAHELHDIVGHALVAINVRASAAAHLGRREQPVSPVAALEEIASTSAEALGELRAALKGLRSDESGGVPLRPPGAGLADLGDLQVTRFQDPHQARRPGPDPAGRHRLRKRTGRARPVACSRRTSRGLVRREGGIWRPTPDQGCAP